jgi:hypothetical protein
LKQNDKIQRLAVGVPGILSFKLFLKTKTLQIIKNVGQGRHAWKGNKDKICVYLSLKIGTFTFKDSDNT